jgi:phage-related protein
MIKQDRNGARTSQDLERRWAHTWVSTKKAVELNTESTNKIDAELESFISIALASLDGIESGSLATYYHYGVPAIDNYPSSEWTEYESHIGDLYYDKATGRAYRFDLVKKEYVWEEVEDRAVIAALALAAASVSAADGEVQVFVSTPTPPYKNGDLWFHNGEILICQVSKEYDAYYEEKDFILATKYTDDTVANQVGDNLEIVRGTVTTIQEGADAFKIDIETTVKSINDLQEETLEAVERMSYTFGTNDLAIANSNDPVNTRINNQGLKVYTYADLQAIFNHRGTGVQKLIVVGDTQLANLSIVKSTDENGNDCTDFNFLVSNVQSLTDLEGGK